MASYGTLRSNRVPVPLAWYDVPREARDDIGPAGSRKWLMPGPSNEGRRAMSVVFRSASSRNDGGVPAYSTCHSMVTFNLGAMGEALSNALVTGLSPTHLLVAILGLGAMVVGYLSFKTHLSHRSREKESVVAVRQCIAMSRQETKRLDLLLSTLWATARAADDAMYPLHVFPVARGGASGGGAAARASSAGRYEGGRARNVRTMAFCTDIVFVGHVSRSHVSARIPRPTQRDAHDMAESGVLADGCQHQVPDHPRDATYSRVDSGAARAIRTRWPD